LKRGIHHLVLKGGICPGITQAIHSNRPKAESWLRDEGGSPILYTQLWPSEGSLVGWWPLTSPLALWPLYCTITKRGGGRLAGMRWPLPCVLQAVCSTELWRKTVLTCQQYYYIY
jgi:hypothetical protein